MAVRFINNDSHARRTVTDMILVIRDVYDTPVSPLLKIELMNLNVVVTDDG